MRISLFLTSLSWTTLLVSLMTVAILIDQVFDWHLFFLTLVMVLAVYSHRSEGIIASLIVSLVHDAVFLYPLGLSFVIVGLVWIVWPWLIKFFHSRILIFELGLLGFGLLFYLIDGVGEIHPDQIAVFLIASGLSAMAVYSWRALRNTYRR